MSKVLISFETGDVDVLDIIESFHVAYQSKAETAEEKEAFFHKMVVTYIGEVHHAHRINTAKKQAEAAVQKIDFSAAVAAEPTPDPI